MRMMKAAVYREFSGPIRIENVPYPSCPADGVVVQVCAAGVCRSDWHGWKGHDSDIVGNLPFVPGHEFSGMVAQVGSAVQSSSSSSSSLRVGDRVVAPFLLSCGSCRYCRKGRPTVCLRQEQPGFTYRGCFAEFVAVPRADRNVKVMPASVSFVQAAALGCRFTTAYRAVLQQGRLQAGETIVIFGCGGVGLSCIMIAAAQHAGTIVAVDVSQESLEKARQLGATHTVRADKKDNLSTRQRVRSITDDDGYDVSVDAAGFASTCENAVYSTKRGGRMIQVGLPIGQVPPQVPMGLVAGHEIEIYGSHGFAADDLPRLLDLIAEGSIDPSVLVERQVSLEEGAQVLMDMDQGSPLGITVITRFRSSHL
jgi:alcohol dehydrogenase